MKCRYFGRCGGCYFNLPYPEQLRLKRQGLEEILPPGWPDFRLIRSERVRGYRSRQDLVYAFGKLGLRRRGSYRHVTDLESCWLMPERANQQLRVIRERIFDLESYDYIRHRGYLRYVTFRSTAFTQELMIIFLTAKRDPRIRELMKAVEAESVVWSVNQGLADVNFGEVREWIGRPWIEERLDAYRFRIGPNCFFQSNPWIARKLFRYLRKLARGISAERIIDLYSGIGCIAVYLSSLAPVMAVESNPESVEYGRINTQLNSCQIEWVQKDVKEWLKEPGEAGLAVLDPPRSGLGGKVLRRLKRWGPESILYISCNPERAVGEILELGYEVQEIRAFDMFPQTPHLEAVFLLSR